MLAEKIRRIFVVSLALAIAAGLVAHFVPGANLGSKSADIAAAMSIYKAAYTSMPGNCDGCGYDQKAMAPAACSAYCGSVVALAVTAITVDLVPAEILGHFAARIGASHTIPPDPHPPRPTILG